MSAPRPTSRTGRAFVAVAILEAFTWSGLLVGMLLEHVLDVTEWGVTIFGPLHGAAFLIYVVVAIAAALKFRWGLGVCALAGLAAVPPLTTIPLERWLRRTGRLETPSD